MGRLHVPGQRRPAAAWLAVLLVILATAQPSAPVKGQSSAIDVRGTWDWIADDAESGGVYIHPRRLRIVIRDQDAATGRFTGALVAASVCRQPPWTGRSIPPVSAVARCRDGGSVVGTLDGDQWTIAGFASDGRLVQRGGKLTASGEWRLSLYGQKFRSTYRATLVEPLEGAGGARRASAVFVLCSRDVLGPPDQALLTCTASVADASGQASVPPPTGDVRWATDAGEVRPPTCRLTTGTGSVASCTVQVTARATDIPVGTAPPVTATYPGDATFSRAVGAPELHGSATGFTTSDLYGPGCNPAATPRPTPACGDPVDPATGNLSLQVADLAIEGRGIPLAVIRTYNALAAAAGSTGRFGAGWTDGYGAFLERGPGRRFTVHLGTGATIPFRARGRGFRAPEWVTASLARGPGGTFVLTFADQGRLTFDGEGRLVGIDDLAREPVTLAYADDGSLASVTSASGRSLTFTSDAAGRVVGVTDPAGRMVAYQYDAAGDLVTVTDVAGAVTGYGYDASHRLTSVTDATGATATTAYDDEGRVVEQVDPLSNRLSFAYLGSFPDGTTIATDGKGVRHAFSHQKGVLVAETAALGTDVEATTRFLHDDRLAVIAMLDATGALWRTTRDARGNMTSVTDPLGRTATLAYDDRNLPVAATTPLGIVTRLEYDAQGMPIRITWAAGTADEASMVIGRDDAAHPADVTSITDPTGATIRYTDDEHGDVIALIDALGHVREATRDALGWVVAMADPLGATTTLVRDVRGNPTSVTDPLGGVRATAYDASGRPVAWTDAMGATTGLTWDAGGRPAELRLADGSTQTAGRDALGELVSQTTGQLPSSTSELDALGRRTAWVDPAGGRWSWSYDAVGRPLSTTDPLGQTTRYHWDVAGQLLGIDHPEGTADVAFEYDPDGRRVAMTDGTGRTTYGWDARSRLVEVMDGSGDVVRATWDARGGLDRLTYPDGLVVDHDTDANGRIVAVRDSLGNESTFTYDAAGRLVGSVLGDGSATTLRHDARGALLGITSVGPDGRTPILEVAYGRDAAARVTSITEAGVSRSLVYDARGRLTQDGDARFAHDAAGNLTRLRERALAYDAGGRLDSVDGPDPTTVSFDLAGRRIAATTHGSASTYAYDAAGRLVATGGSTHGYDGAGLRMSSVTADGETARFTWLRGGGRPLLLGDGTSRFIHGPAGPIAQVDASGTVTWLHLDGIGSVRALTDSAGSLVATFDWDAYGMPSARTGVAATRLGFHGQYTDPDTGFQHLPARVYDPATGQFLTVDPSVLETHHAYAFAAGDPISFGDPTGGEPEANVILAGHGRWIVDNGTTIVPEGTTITFYQPAGSKMYDYYGYRIETGREGDYQEVYGPGSTIPNYTLSRPKELLTEASSVTVSKETTLAELLQPNMGSVGWAACRMGTTEYPGPWRNVWRPYDVGVTSDEDGGWAGIRIVTDWREVSVVQQGQQGHTRGPHWGHEGPSLESKFDPAWWDWDSGDIVPMPPA